MDGRVVSITGQHCIFEKFARAFGAKGVGIPQDTKESIGYVSFGIQF